MNRFNILMLLILVGCTPPTMNERIKRGDPGTPGYIAPDYRPCKIILFQPEVIKEVGGKTVFIQPYTIIEDDRGRRYSKIGKIGESGDEFEMDVSLAMEIK